MGTTALVSIVMLSNAALADGDPAAEAPSPPPSPVEDTPPPMAKKLGGIELELKGYAQFGLAGILSRPAFEGGESFDFVDGNSVVFGSDSEVHFMGKTTLDNGLAISFRAELELEDDPEVDDDADIVDEVYVQFDGGFGRLQFGMQDGVGDQMIISAPNVFSQFTISSIDMNPFEMFTSSDIDDSARDLLGESSVLDTSPDFSEDSTKIIYFTPRIFGFQLGVSYAPNPCRNDTGLDVNTSAASDSDPDPTASCGADRAFGSNYWEVAGNFEHEWSGFGLGLSASYGQGDENPFNFALNDNPSEWHVGGEFFFKAGSGKFTVGGAYKETDNLSPENSGGIFNDSQHWDAGAKYSFGAWEIGGAFGRVEGSEGLFEWDQQTLTTIIGGVSYNMGPGVKIGVGVMHSDAEVASFVEGFLAELNEANSTAIFSELDLRF